ncbi:MAG: anti-sigma F factor [Eubacteriales bacterium]
MKKKTVNEMVLNFKAISRNECFARQAVCAFAAQLDPTLEELSDLRVLISEGVTNCIVHAYKGLPCGMVELSVKYYDDRTLKLKIRDRGCGIEDIEKCMQPLYTTDPDGERGGMGFPIMKSLSDRLSVISHPGKGTTLTLVKRFSPPGEEDDT